MAETPKYNQVQALANHLKAASAFDGQDIGQVQATMQALHPSHRPDGQTKAMLANLADWSKETAIAYTTAIANLPGERHEQDRHKGLTDTDFATMQAGIVKLISDHLASVAPCIEGTLQRAAYDRLSAEAIEAVTEAKSGSRTASVLVPLKVGDVLTNGAHRFTVASVDDKGNPSDAKGQGLSASAKVITGHSTNGRAFWKLNGRKLTV